MSIGEELKDARERKGLSLDAVEEATNIRKKYIRAMEDDKFDVLPGRVYAKAFLRTYAKFLDLDVESLLAEFNKKHPVEKRDIASDAGITSPIEPKRPRYLSYLLVIIIVAALMAFNALYNPGPWSGTPDDSGTQVVEQKEPGQNTQPGPPDRKQVKQAVGVDVTLEVVKERCWMRVWVDGEMKYEGILSSGESLNFKGDTSVKLRLGNPRAVRVTANGKELGFLSEQKHPITHTITADEGQERS
ncbi:MAG: helix-turn-helix domain-containing protein [Peptococcaceae bacterium]|nr:helix-turn-helix domain-containing protein [Peptococcaceae bacterium]